MTLRPVAGVLIATVIGCALARADGKTTEPTFEELAIKAREDIGKDGGSGYHAAMAETYTSKLSTGIAFCMRNARESSSEAFQAVLVVMSDGKVRRVLVDRQTQVSKCIQERLSHATFPKPPFAPFHNLMKLRVTKESESP